MGTIPKMNKFRPDFHITPKTGWINDPNGFLFFKGQYHLFVQHNPYDVVWGPMHWLHFVSKDLLNFEEVGIALKNDESYDKEFGCFSGSAIVKDDIFYLLYTGAMNGKQVQCIASSKDGFSFSKYKNNPVIDESLLPNGYLISDFRDPKVFKHGDYYYLLISCKHKDDYSSILLYKSKDLFSYEFVSVLLSSGSNEMIECPTIIFENGKCALIYAIQFKKQVGLSFQNVHSVVYQIGNIDLVKGAFTPTGELKEYDNGFDVYAPQVIEKNNKNYLIYWLAMWDNSTPSIKEGYAGQLSSVREIHIVDDCLVSNFINPIKELANYKKVVVDVNEDIKSFTVYKNIEITLNKFENEITISRKHMSDEIVCNRGLDVTSRTFKHKINNQVDFEFFFDNSVVEILIDKGKASFSLLDFNKDSEIDNF